MHLTTYVVSAAAIFHFAHCAPAPDMGDPMYASEAAGPVCSADTSTAAVIPSAQDPNWGSSMNACVTQLDNDNWNGYHCIPNDGKGNMVGPTAFGFYKGGKGAIDAQTCYNLCQPCLAKGIANQRAVTTSCRWGNGHTGTCWMGFDYGGKEGTK